MSFLLKQIRTKTGVVVNGYLTDNRDGHHIAPRYYADGPDRTRIYKTVQQAEYDMRLMVQYFGGMWAIFKKQGVVEMRIKDSESHTPKTMAQIERCILRGKHITGSEMNRFARSSRGAAFLSAIEKK